MNIYQSHCHSDDIHRQSCQGDKHSPRMLVRLHSVGTTTAAFKQVAIGGDLPLHLVVVHELVRLGSGEPKEHLYKEEAQQTQGIEFII